MRPRDIFRVFACLRVLLALAGTTVLALGGVLVVLRSPRRAALPESLDPEHETEAEAA